MTFETTGRVCGRPAPERSLVMGILRCGGCGKEMRVMDTWERIRHAGRNHVCAPAEPDTGASEIPEARG